jgi:hypothetical protein
LGWVGARHADALVEAWRICDVTWTRRPLWNHCGLPKYAMPGPLVPDLLALKPAETAYYRTIALDKLDEIQGTGAWIRHEPDERNRDYVISELYERQTLPGLEQAATLLEKEAAGAEPAIAAILLRQREHILFATMIQRSHYNWYEAGRHIVPGANPGTGRSMTAIVDDEIANTIALVALLDGRQEQFMRTMSSDQMTYEFGPGFTSHLKERITVMQRHRSDPTRTLTDSLGKFHAYLKDMEV